MLYEDDFPVNEGDLCVIHCILSTPKESDAWKRTSIFHTFVPISGKTCKLVIDRGSSINVVSKSAIA